MTAPTSWSRGAVIYQIYPRSYQDSNADGVGDLPGILSRLDHIAELGVDGIWISPFFPSPMKDFGYDVSDYCGVDPVFGTLDDFRNVLDKAHALGLKILIDQVWSHSSDKHVWFWESRQSRDNPRNDWYVWADPKQDGTAPNNWLSYFGGPAWTWDSRREQYYLHHFLKEQPTLNLWNPVVRDAIKETARFWLDMGVDGFRLDAAHTYLFKPGMKDNPARRSDDPWPTDVPKSNPMARQRRVNSMCVPENLDFIEELSAFINQWPDRCILGEAGGDDSETIAVTYTQTGKRFHMAYSFGLVGSAMTREDIAQTAGRVEGKLGDGWICWATSNHDFKRPVSRMAPPAGMEREAALLNMAIGLSLRGSYCLYQGEELGLPQADLTFEELVDPYDIMLYPDHAGRDGCRTPMPWDHTKPHAGFTESARPWLPVKRPHLDRAVSMQKDDPQSVLSAYKRMLAFRKRSAAMKTGAIAFLDSPGAVLAFRREQGEERILCVFNTSPDPADFDLAPFASAFSVTEGISGGAGIEGERLTLQGYGFALLI